jgi:hypothetical protein
MLPPRKTKLQRFREMDPITAKAAPQRDFAKPPEGQHQGVLVDVIDLGMQPNTFNGQTNGFVHKCALVWQIDAINSETSKPFEVSKEFTVSMGEKANLRKFLGQWRGKSYSDAEAEAGAPLHKLYGINAMLAVEHKQSKANPDRSYVNILSATALHKSAEKLEPLDYKRADWWKDKVGKQEPPPPSDDDAPADDADDLPF